MKHINAVLTDLGVKQEHIHYEFSAQQQAYNKLSFNKQKNEVLFHLVFILVIVDLLFRGVYRSVDQFQFALIFHI